jgi:putative intracellular protease/amidase
MAAALKILLLVTSQATMGDSPRPTGVWLEELTTPYYAFVDAGAEVDIASIKGGPVPLDPHSVVAAGGNPPSVERFLHDRAAMARLQTSAAVTQLDGRGYAAVFLPGGHGTMWDFPDNTALATLLGRMWRAGKVVAAVCHGPAGLLGVSDAQGRPLVNGRHISAFTDSEEAAAGLDRVVPFLLETRLRAQGALFERGVNFQPHAVRDGQLVTGQNPASSLEVARLVLEAVHPVPVTH